MLHQFYLKLKKYIYIKNLYWSKNEVKGSEEYLYYYIYNLSILSILT